jgi:hypothetical protein
MTTGHLDTVPGLVSIGAQDVLDAKERCQQSNGDLSLPFSGGPGARRLCRAYVMPHAIDVYAMPCRAHTSVCNACIGLPHLSVQHTSKGMYESGETRSLVALLLKGWS